MPRYLYTGPGPLILTGLAQGTNAWLEPADGTNPPAGTVVAYPGDTLDTAEPYDHALLELAGDATETPDPDDTPDPAEPAETPTTPATKRKTPPTQTGTQE